MENYITGLVLAAGLIFKLYSGYQKEQQKAAQRKQNMPKGPQPSAIPIPTVKPTKMVSAKPAVPHSSKNKPALPPLPTVLNRPSIKPNKLPSVPQLEKKSLMTKNPAPTQMPKALSASEIARLKQKQKIKSDALKIKPLVVEEIQEAPRFDLKQAIISKAILERPYA